MMINYLTREVSATWSEKPRAKLRRYDEVHMVCALTLLTPELKSRSETSSTVPTAVRGSDRTMEENQAYFEVFSTTL